MQTVQDFLWDLFSWTDTDLVDQLMWLIGVALEISVKSGSVKKKSTCELQPKNKNWRNFSIWVIHLMLSSVILLTDLVFSFWIFFFYFHGVSALLIFSYW